MPKEPIKSKTARPKLRSSHGVSDGPKAAPKKSLKNKVKKLVGSKKASAERIPSQSLARGARSELVREASQSVASDAARKLTISIASAALEKKAVGLEVLDVAGRVDYADFLMLMTGRSDRQVIALSQGIEDELKKQGKRAISVEGLPVATWVLMDYGDVVVHIFQEEARQSYNLDGLWTDARRMPVEEK